MGRVAPRRLRPPRCELAPSSQPARDRASPSWLLGWCPRPALVTDPRLQRHDQPARFDAAAAGEARGLRRRSGRADLERRGHVGSRSRPRRGVRRPPSDLAEGRNRCPGSRVGDPRSSSFGGRRGRLAGSTGRGPHAPQIGAHPRRRGARVVAHPGSGGRLEHVDAHGGPVVASRLSAPEGSLSRLVARSCRSTPRASLAAFLDKSWAWTVGRLRGVPPVREEDLNDTTNPGSALYPDGGPGASADFLESVVASERLASACARR